MGLPTIDNNHLNSPVSVSGSAQRSLPTRKVAGLAMAVLAGALLLPACSNRVPTAEQTTEGMDSNAATSTYEEEVAEQQEPLEQIAKEPYQVALDVGSTVSVNGEVVATYDKGVFLVRDQEYFSPDAGVLVVAQDPQTMNVPDVGEYVQLTGELQLIGDANIEVDYDITQDDDYVRDLETEYVEVPIIVAQEIQPQQATTQ